MANPGGLRGSACLSDSAQAFQGRGSPQEETAAVAGPFTYTSRMSVNLPRVEALLGSKLDQVTEPSLRRLVEHRVVEDADLDFKRTPHDDGEKLAADVTAMANTVGGVLVLGVDEADGVATSLTPGPLTDEVSNRMTQWLAEYVAPYLATEIRRVPTEADESQCYYLVVIPRSADAPHAVASRRKGTLRYYQRDGGRNRPLAESEVANEYRTRFRGEQSQIDRLQTVSLDGARAVAVDKEAVWLAASLVPNSPGMTEISARRVREIDAWARGYGGHRGDGPFERWQPGGEVGSGQVMTGVGRFLLSSVLRGGVRPRFCHAELHRDGAGFAASEFLQQPDKQGTPLGLRGADVFTRAAGLVRLLVDHAVMNTGANGEALARCELLVGEGAVVQLGFLGAFGDTWEAYTLTRALHAAPSVETHTISLDAVARNPVERLVAARLLVTDIVHAFGLPEVLQVTSEGDFNLSYWDDARQLQAWTSMASVPRVRKDIRYW